MNPARTIGPALASATYKGIWVYMVGPVIGTLLGAYTYNLIRESDRPVHAISQQSLSFKLCRIRSNDGEFVNKNTLQTVWCHGMVVQIMKNFFHELPALKIPVQASCFAFPTKEM